MNFPNWKKVTIPIITVLVIFGIVSSVYNEFDYTAFNDNASNGIDVFYRVQQPGIHIWFFLILSVAIPVISSLNYFVARKSKHQNYIITRIGYRNYIKKNLLSIFISSFFFRLFCSVVLLLIINFFFSPIHNIPGSAIYEPTIYAYSNNMLVSLFFYLLYSSLGTAIFGMLVYSLGFFIKNLYLYLITGLLCAIIGIVGIALIMGALNFLPEIVINIVGVMFFSETLLVPGIELIGNINSYFNCHIIFLISAFGYTVLFLPFLYFGISKEYCRG